MASLLMHLAITKELIKNNLVTENSLFYLGSILPDAVTGDDNIHKESHFIKYLDDGFKVIDFEEFYNNHFVQIRTNHLYFGYYLHLIEDAIYRSMLANEFGILKYRMNSDFKEALYSDYHKINEYLTKKYKLDEIDVVDIEIPSKISKIVTFDTNILIEGIALQTNEEKQKKEFNYFNYNMIDTYIGRSIDLIEQEVGNIIENRKSLIKITDFKY